VRPTASPCPARGSAEPRPPAFASNPLRETRASQPSVHTAASAVLSHGEVGSSTNTSQLACDQWGRARHPARQACRAQTTCSRKQSACEPRASRPSIHPAGIHRTLAQGRSTVSPCPPRRSAESRPPALASNPLVNLEPLGRPFTLLASTALSHRGGQQFHPARPEGLQSPDHLLSQAIRL